MRNAKTAAPSLETMEALLAEVVEAYAPLEKLYRKLRGLQRGSEAYLDLLGDLDVATEILRMKAEHANLGVNEIVDSLPD